MTEIDAAPAASIAWRRRVFEGLEWRLVFLAAGDGGGRDVIWLTQ